MRDVRTAVDRLLMLRDCAPPGAEHWWDRASAAVEGEAELLGLPFPVFAGVVAVLSPQRKWERNIGDAVSAVRGEPLPLYTRRQRGVVERLLNGDLGAVRGPKVSVFHRLLLDPTRRLVCVDRHVLAACGVDTSFERTVTVGEKRRAELLMQLGADEKGEHVPRFQAAVWEAQRTEAWRR